MTTIQTPKEKKNMGLSAINIRERREEYVLYVAAPGVQREDIYVSVENGILTVTATEKKNETVQNRIKPDPLVWKKTLKLPENADPLLTAATCINGEVQIHIPKGDNREERPVMIHVF